MTITDEELARLEALTRAATPGPWVTDADEPIAAETHAEVCFEDDYGSHTIATEMSCDDARFLMAARDAVPALVAEVRRLAADLDLSERARATMLAAVAERDALRAENERLRSELRYEAITERATLGAERDAARLTSEELTRANLAMARERDALRAEAAELRASLADAVGKIAAMEPVVEAARALRHYDTSVECRGDSAIQFCRLEREHRQAIDAYEASLPRLTLERETVTAMATLDPKGRGVTTE